MNLDDNKEFGYEAYVYYFFDDENQTKSPKQKFQQSIFFLNRLLTNVETRYWFTELKVVDIIWVVKKIRHMIEITIHIIIIYTNHSAAITIVK